MPQLRLGAAKYIIFFFKRKKCKTHRSSTIKVAAGGIPGGSVVKSPPAQEGDTGSIPELGRSHMSQSS